MSINLCQIDRAVLEAHTQGANWRTVHGIRSAARFHRVARAQWCQLDQEAQS